jgi:hypothetical protein
VRAAVWSEGVTLWLPQGTAAAFERRATPEEERPLPRDPVEFAQGAGVHLWSKQREIARSVVENRVTLVPSCHAAGKTFLAATIGSWWIAGAPPGERIVITTAPTDRQVAGLLWQEFAKAHGRYGLPGTITGTQWHIGTKGARLLVGFGAKPQDLTDLTQATQRFQGYHRPEGVLFILDEATGIPSWLWTAGDTITTSDHDRVLAIGNPDDPSSEFAARCDASTGSTRAPGKRYETRHATVVPIDAMATPNLTGEQVPEYIRKQLISRATVERWGDQWGKTNPLYISKVRGQFPDRSSHNVISPALIRRAWALDLPGMEAGCFGLDVARSAHGDESALYRDRGGQIRSVWVTRESDSTNLVAGVLRRTAKLPQVPVAVDADGLGGPVYDMIRRGFPDLGLPGRRAIPFMVSSLAHNKRDFDTRRSEMWWTVRSSMENGLWDLDEEDDELAAQLMAPHWTPRMGVIHVESKAELEKRGISSPDRADAAIIAFMGNAMARRRRMGAASNGNDAGRGRSMLPETGDLMTRAL